MLPEDKAKIIGELFKENPNVVRGYLIAGEIKRATTLEAVDLIEERLRKEGLLASNIVIILIERREYLYLEKVRAATTEDQIVKAFCRIPIRYTEASELAVHKMSEIIQECERKEILSKGKLLSPYKL